MDYYILTELGEIATTTTTTKNSWDLEKVN